MNRSSMAVLIAALLGGCATQATNEPAAQPSAQPSRSGSATAAAAPAPARAPAPTPFAQTRGKTASAKEPGARSVYYEYDRAELKREDTLLIHEHAQYLRANPTAKVRIEGNADERGSSEYNLALGQRRAEGVMKALRAGGVSEERMEAVSFGKEKPKAHGHDESSWSQNRRSDMQYR
jgi:peptidoglycan-associated lipoprotein